ncbi:MAG: outer membrane lipoprotein LolB [Proteobacteria bacterium]|jgi:outer membrane lipoprotein LolB|nr:outer membrane lipoprotein LolB [Pseudomonadota bacterium]
MSITTRVLGLVLSVCLMSACASGVKVATEDAVFKTDREWFRSAELQLKAVDSWTMRGRIAVRFDNKGETGSILWRESAAQQSVRLNGPFGAGAVELKVDALGAEITDRNGNSRRATNAQTLLFESTGWIVPVANLRYWLQGLPGPEGIIEYRVNDKEQLVELLQGGWRVEYSTFKEFDGLILPARLTAHLSSSNDTKVRLVIDQWDWR